MFTSFLSLTCLLGNILCDRSRSDDSDRCSSDFSEEKHCYVDCFTEKCEKLGNLKPFLCYDKCCPTFNNKCKPYIEFANVAVFLTSIPNAKKFKNLYRKNDVPALIKLASQCTGCDNYDALSAFFYNADAHSGIFDRKFDSNFILFFITRFYYFLDLILENPNIKVYNNNLYCTQSHKCFDLLCIPEAFADLTFGSEAEALRLFNSIIQNPVINDVLLDFIRVLLYQINSANCRCVGRDTKLSGFNTFTVYISLLKEYLWKTREISNANVVNVESYGASQVPSFFVYLPYVLASNNLPAIAFINVDANVYTGPKTYDFLQSRY